MNWENTKKIHVYIYDIYQSPKWPFGWIPPKNRGKTGIFDLYKNCIFHDRPWSQWSSLDLCRASESEMRGVKFPSNDDRWVFLLVEKKKNVVCFGGLGWCWVMFFWWFGFVDVIWMLRWENCWTICWRWCDYRREIQSREDVPICWFEKGLQQRSCTRWPRWPCLMCKYLV